MTHIPSAVGKRYWKVLILQDQLPGQQAKIVCDCGQEKLVRRYDIFNGKIKSCGSTECAGKWIDISGKKFDQLTVLNYVGLAKNKQTIIWNCKCACGKLIKASYIALATGHKKSCGCIKSERISRAQAIPIKDAAEHQIYNSYKSGAKQRKLSFHLSRETFTQFLYRTCHYCGADPSNFIRKTRVTGEELHFFNGVDRINNEKGYTEDNCVPCCKICNHAKKDLTVEDFIKWVGRVAIKQGFIPIQSTRLS